MKVGKTHTGKYGPMKNLYNAYANNNSKFGCEITLMKLDRKSRFPEVWELKVHYTYDKDSQRERFEYEVDMTYDLYYNKTHALKYYYG